VRCPRLKRKNRRGKVVFCCIGFYFITTSHKDRSITSLKFGLVWFRERKLRGRSCVAVMRERERERERWLRKKKRGWAWMGIQLDMEYCEVDYEKKKKQATTRRRRLLLLFAIQVALLFV
jgi:hypothetical protein